MTKLLFAILLLTMSTKLFAMLGCKNVHISLSYYFYHHLEKKSFDPELIHKTFLNYAELLDEEGIILDEENKLSFGHKYQIELLKFYFAEPDCNFILDSIDDFKNYSAFHFLWKEDFSKLPWDVSKETISFRKRIKNQINNEFLSSQKIKLFSEQQSKKIIQKKYYRLLKKAQAKSESDYYQLFLEAFAKSLDPYSRFLYQKKLYQYGRSLSLTSSYLDFTVNNVGIYQKVTVAEPGSTIKKDDLITGIIVNGTNKMAPTYLVSNREFLEHLSFNDFALQIHRPSNGKYKKMTVNVTRKSKQKEQERVKRIVFKEAPNVLVIKIPSFYYTGFFSDSKQPVQSMTADVIKIIKEHPRKKILLDLRSNFGGFVSEALELSSVFIGKKTVYIDENDSPLEKIHGQNKGEFTQQYFGELYLLTDRYCASACEMFSLAIQDWKRGLVIGDGRTYGKGVMQDHIEMINQSTLKVTNERYFGPSGRGVQNEGVKSDVVVSSPLSFSKITEEIVHNYPFSARHTSPAVDFVKKDHLKLEEKQLKLQQQINERAQPYTVINSFIYLQDSKKMQQFEEDILKLLVELIK